MRSERACEETLYLGRTLCVKLRAGGRETPKPAGSIPSMRDRPFQFRLRNALLAVAIVAVVCGFLKRSVIYTLFTFMGLITIAVAGIAAWSLTQDCLKRIRERSAEPSRPVRLLATVFSVDTLSVAIIWLVVVCYSTAILVMVASGFFLA